MSKPSHIWRWRVAPLLLLAALSACDATTDGPVEPQLGILDDIPRAFEVYTQNVYLGGDTEPLFSIDFGDVPAVVAATNVFWQEVQQSNVAERMPAIVSEIALRRPNAVGLQEALQFVLLDGAFQPIGALDFLALIEAEIAARGLPYVTEVVQPTTSSALPLELGPTGVTKWLGFTDRLVVLRRTDVTVTSTAGGVFTAGVPLGPLTIKRGWARLTTEHEGRTHHFVTTHLETQAVPPVQAAQSAELLGSVLAGLDGVVLVAGDLNSDAEASPGDPSWTPTYGDFLSAGFVDLWDKTLRSRFRVGYTCCQAPDLRNPLSELDERIDFVLLRTSGPHGRAFTRAAVVGDKPWDRTASGLWPSDHAGVFGTVRVVGH